MFSRWGAFVYRFRRPIAGLSLLLAVGSVFFASKAAGELSSGGWLDKSSESAAVIDRLDASFSAGKSTFIALFRSSDQTDASSAAFQAEKDLQRAETISAPLALLILLAVFASVVAAGMPLIIAGLAIPTTLAAVYFVAQQVSMSIYVLNIATMLGLALAIDYSLFIVS